MNIIYSSDKCHKTVNRALYIYLYFILFMFAKEYTTLKVQTKSLTLLIQLPLTNILDPNFSTTIQVNQKQSSME